MRHTKRLLAFLAAFVLTIPLFCVTAFAADDDTYNFVVDNQTAGYKYVLYEMFTGDTAPNPNSTSDDDKYILSNVKWGSSVLVETQEAMYDMFELEGANRTATAVAEAIASSADSDIFHSMMTYMAQQGKTGGASLQPFKNLALGTYDVNGTSVEGYGVEGIPSGYYLVRNTAVPSGDPTATYSDYIVRVAGEDVCAETKVATPTTQLKLKDINDSNDEGLSGLKDSADHDYGDTIPNTITSTLPMNYGAYDQSGFNMKWELDMDKGLDWDGTATIYYGDDVQGETIQFIDVTGTDITHDDITETLESSFDGGKVWMFDGGNLKQTHPELGPNDTIRIEYNTVLNDDAIVGPTGNATLHRIIYTNNPTDYSHLNASEFDKTVVYVYRTTFHKVDEATGEALPGADFLLEKFDHEANAWVDVTALHTETGAKNPVKNVNDAGTEFSFIGLDDGKYRITESTTPAGYNTMEPKEFTISATHHDGDSPVLESLEGTSADGLEMTTNLNTATLSATITNRAGVVLPTSGARGNTATYIAGTVLVIGAVAVLASRRRARA